MQLSYLGAPDSSGKRLGTFTVSVATTGSHAMPNLLAE